MLTGNILMLRVIYDASRPIYIREIAMRLAYPSIAAGRLRKQTLRPAAKIFKTTSLAARNTIKQRLLPIVNERQQDFQSSPGSILYSTPSLPQVCIHLEPQNRFSQRPQGSRRERNFCVHEILRKRVPLCRRYRPRTTPEKITLANQVEAGRYLFRSLYLCLCLCCCK